MLPLQMFKRCFHLSHRGPIMSGQKPKTVKDVIRAVNSSSLIKKEEYEVDKTKLPSWKIQQLALRKKFGGERWNPSKKLSREQMEGLRLIKTQFPHLTARDLGEQFKVSPEVVRRILKTKWQPNEKEMARIQERWQRRGDRIQQMYETVQQEHQNTIPQPCQELVAIPKQISIDSSRGAPKFVVRRRKSFQKKKTGRNKLYLLQHGST
ncbi:RRG9 (YNL213C) [Zygosaccharomyces parabailii]|nr:RRG9 (YNL213C) [Zygosaccharomyces parabailii]